MRRTRGRDRGRTRPRGGGLTTAPVRILTGSAAEAGNVKGKRGIAKPGTFRTIIWVIVTFFV